MLNEHSMHTSSCTSVTIYLGLIYKRKIWGWRSMKFSTVIVTTRKTIPIYMLTNNAWGCHFIHRYYILSVCVIVNILNIDLNKSKRNVLFLFASLWLVRLNTFHTDSLFFSNLPLYICCLFFYCGIHHLTDL